MPGTSVHTLLVFLCEWWLLRVKSARMDDSQAPIDGGTLSRAKCNLTAKFNDIYFQATRFQTCSGSVLSTGPQLRSMLQAWYEFTRNVCEWGMFTKCLMSVCVCACVRTICVWARNAASMHAGYLYCL